MSRLVDQALPLRRIWEAARILVDEPVRDVSAEVVLEWSF